MLSRRRFPSLARHPLVALSLAFSLGLSLTILLIVALPSRAAAPARPAPAPQQTGLEISNQVQDKVLVYENLTYTVRFTNTSGQMLENVVITNTWATDSASYSGDPPPAEYNGNLSDPAGVVDNYTWTLNSEAGALYIDVGTLNPGVAATLIFTRGVPDSLEPNNKQKVGPSILGESLDIGTSTSGVENASHTVATTVVGPVFKLTKVLQTETGEQNMERPGRLITITLFLENLGEEQGRSDGWPATQVRISDTIPSQLVYLESQPLGTYLTSTGFITWALPGTLNPGETAAVTYTVRVTTTDWDSRIFGLGKGACSAIAAERLTPAICDNHLTLIIRSPLDKSVATNTPPDRDYISYPNRTITYTVYIYNPLQIPVTGLTVTDTLPSEHITYVDMVDGPAPIGSPSQTVVWEGLSLSANDIISFTFRAHVGAQTEVQSNCRDKTYENHLAAAAPEWPVVYDTTDFTSNHLKVSAQIELDKVVAAENPVDGQESDEQIEGQTVVYTVTINNNGDTPVTLDILTDTLPPAFIFEEMILPAPPSTPTVNGNILIWDDVPTIPAEGSLEFSFRVTVNGILNEELENNLDGFSSDTYICDNTGAGVFVRLAVHHLKDAIPANPTHVVQGETFEYQVTYDNWSTLRSYDIDEFYDNLPSGFFDVMSNTKYIYTITPSFTLLPERANSWQHTFSVTVVGEGSRTAWCDALGKEEDRIIPQLEGTFGVHIVEPLRYTANGGDQQDSRAVYVKPHVDLIQTYYPDQVGMSDTLTVTLTLLNNMRDMRGAQAQPVDDITVTYEIHNDFNYLGIVPGTPDPAQDGNILTWSNIDLPESGTVELFFLLQAPFKTYATYRDIIARAWAADPNICIPLSESGRIEVNRGVTLKKTPDPDEVGPFGTVEYTIDVRNRTSAPARNIRFTDTLPFGFKFLGMTEGSAPVSQDPLVWEIPLLEGESSQRLIYRVRAYVNLGPQYNWLDGITSSTHITLDGGIERYMRDVKVQVLPSVGFYKTVAPQQILAGQPATYTVVLYNGSEYDMANVVLTDTLPAGFSFGGMGQGAEPDDNRSQDQHIVWLIEQLDRNQSAKFIFYVNTDPQLFSGTYYNRIEATAWDAASPSDPVDVPASDQTAPVVVQGLPSVERTKTVTPTLAAAGDFITYAITLYNDTEEAHTVRLTDTLPVSITYVEVVGSTPGPTLTAPIVWSDLQISPKQTLTLQFKAQVAPLAVSGTYYNRLDVTVDTFPMPALSQLAPLTVEGIPRYDLQISKTDGRVAVDEAEVLLYTITYTNVTADGLTLNNVVITDTFNPGSPYVEAVGVTPQWDQVTPNVYRHVVGDLGPGQSGALTFGLQLSTTIPPEIMTISNSVEIDHETAELAIETDGSNNRSTDVDILQGPDLVIDSIEVSPSNPQAGQPVNFTVTVRNQGEGQTLHANGEDAWFLVELYLKGSGFTPAGPPASVFDHTGGICANADCTGGQRDAYYVFAAGLDGAGDWATLDFTVVVTEADTYNVYAQADVSFDVMQEPWGHAYGVIREALEDNNVFAYGTVAIGGDVPDFSIYLPVVTKNR